MATADWPRHLRYRQIVTDDGLRWKRADGYLYGAGRSRYGQPCLLEATQERIEAAAAADEKEKLVSQLGRVDWDTHGLETLRQVAAAVEGRPS